MSADSCRPIWSWSAATAIRHLSSGICTLSSPRPPSSTLIKRIGIWIWFFFFLFFGFGGVEKRLLTFLVGTRHVCQIVVMDQIVAAKVCQFGVRIAQQHFPPLVHGHERQIQFVLALEHHVLLRDFEQRGRAERCAQGEQRQRWLLRFPVLTVQYLHSSPDVQTLKEKKNRILLD